jgi:hypothetical protein
MNMTTKRAIYTKIDKKYYQINQPVSIPKVVRPDVVVPHSQMEIRGNHVTATIWIDNINRLIEYSNGELYSDMVDHLRNELVTEMPLIQNKYVLYVDYSIYNENNVEVKHGITTNEMNAMDTMYPLDVASPEHDCELKYKLVKCFDGSLDFATVKTEYPFGIIRDTSKSKFVLVVNSLKILQDTIYKKDGGVCPHSTRETSYPYGTHTIESSLKEMKVISDTEYQLIPIEVQFIPESITLNFHIMLDNYIVAADQNVINNIIVENIATIRKKEEEESEQGDDESNPPDESSGNNTGSGSGGSMADVDDEI